MTALYDVESRHKATAKNISVTNVREFYLWEVSCDLGGGRWNEIPLETFPSQVETSIDWFINQNAKAFEKILQTSCFDRSFVN